VKKPQRLAADEAQLASVAQRLANRNLEPGDYELLKVVIDTVCYLSRIVQQKATSIQRLLRMIFGSRTEKTATVIKRHDPDGAKPESGPVAPSDASRNKRRKGHGRRAAGTYWGAKKVTVAHEQFKPGDACPGCDKGRLYDTDRPAVLLRLSAQPIVAGTVFELAKLRCALCGELFSATAPAEAGQEKYDLNVAPTLAVMRYGYGMPTNRLAQLQQDVGVPLPAGTQWELMQAHAQELEPVWEEFLRQAANGDLFHNDDTTARILSLEKQIREDEASSTPDAKQRTGVFTTGIIAKRQERTFALFFSGGQHAGENLQALLDRRAPDLATPIQMCDGLSRNRPATAATNMANCNSHGRRGFVTVADAFPEECAHVLETMREVYKYDEQTRREAMSDLQRLMFHQQHSGPLMDALRRWMEEKIEGRHVEPNSALGEAISYMLKRWERLTLFLRQPGAPLDNNICERLLKTSIRHRNNSLFYKTLNGAHVGDLFMSLIHTCRLARANPFDYLSTLRRYIRHVRDDPATWLPWNYQGTAAALAGI
jgi:transposase